VRINIIHHILRIHILFRIEVNDLGADTRHHRGDSTALDNNAAQQQSTSQASPGVEVNSTPSISGPVVEVNSTTSISGPVVSIRDVTHRYGDVVALDRISLDIPRGIMVGIIGPDGVGKSTLMALVAGSKKLQDGAITVLDGDIASARHRRDACPRIAYMPQGLGKNLYLELSVYDNVDFMAQLFGLSKAERQTRIKQLLEATGLAPFVSMKSCRVISF